MLKELMGWNHLLLVLLSRPFGLAIGEGVVVGHSSPGSWGPWSIKLPSPGPTRSRFQYRFGNA